MPDLSDALDVRLARYRALTEERRSRALRIVSAESRRILEMLPLLLHFNDPRLPGWREGDMPCGIDCLVLSERQRGWLSERGIDPDSGQRGSHSILGLYVMGSTSSICQGVRSDLDIWVCVGADLSRSELELLTETCHFISSFAKTLGADLNLFVTAENRFIRGSHGTLDTEDCGSAQNLFLLDEFYRSSFRLCGRYIIWYLISPEEENRDYRGAVRALYAGGRLDPGQWFDLGSVAKSSPDEYFGSGLWLLYKGIDHPFKAVLKILLMEVYAHEYPNTRLLSSALKERMYKSARYDIGLDAYYLMFKKVVGFLTREKDFYRLNLARQCFYLKLKQGIVDLPDIEAREYRRKLLGRLCRNWGWTLKQRMKLRSREHWKVSFINKMLDDLFFSLHKSYRALLRFSIGHGIEAAITSDDTGILSRKLYAAFDGYPGKVLLLNREFCEYLEEPRLTFIKPSPGSLCESGWHVYPAASGSLDILHRPNVYTAQRLCQAVAFVTFNKVLTSRTLIDLGGDYGHVTAGKIHALSRDIHTLLGARTGPVTERELQQSRYVSRALIVVNFERDATRDSNLGLSELEGGSVLCCGRARECLIGSIDMVTLNSWGEIQCLNFPDGEEGTVELLSTLLRIRRLVSGKHYTEHILAYSDKHRELIRYELEVLLRRILSLSAGEEFVFEVGLNTYAARLNGERDTAIMRRSPFNSSGFNVQVLSRYGMRPEFALQVPIVVDKEASIGVKQYFFAPAPGGWDIYIVNELNEVRIIRGFSRSRSELVNAINRFYARQSEETSGGHSLHFNLPQYFVLSRDLRSMHPFTIRSQESSRWA